jgi:hypothetical protein
MPNEINIKKLIGKVLYSQPDEADPTHFLVHFSLAGGNIEGMVELFTDSADLPYAPGDPVGIILGSHETSKLVLPGTAEYERRKKQLLRGNEPHVEDRRKSRR